MKLRSQHLSSWLTIPVIFVLLAALSPLFGQDEAPPYESYDAFAESGGFALFTVNNLWLLISAALVFIMHLGFSCVETGLTQSKNTVNILFKNLFIVSIGIVGYAFYGFNAMYPGDFNGFFATGSWFGVDNDDVTMMTDAYASYTWWTDFIFQAMFAATAATIVSGAVAERIKLGSFMVYAALLVTFFYPITGSWQWGGGWLAERGFYDFAGSSRARLRWFRRAGGRHGARPSRWQVSRWWQSEADPRSLHASRRYRCVPPLVGLVWLQRWFGAER